MTSAIDIGTDATGRPVSVDVEELLATRLLVQGNSGSGKSHLLRRLLEENPQNPHYLFGEHGVGYGFTKQTERVLN